MYVLKTNTSYAKRVGKEIGLLYLDNPDNGIINHDIANNMLTILNVATDSLGFTDLNGDKELKTIIYRLNAKRA